MKNFNQYITEKIKLPATRFDVKHTEFPKYKHELVKLIKSEVNKNGWECDLNHIDVSNVRDMKCLFAKARNGGSPHGYGLENFNGDISKWDVSSVEDMSYMFAGSIFDGDISAWDVSGVTTMCGMFEYAKFFNSKLNDWNIENVYIMDRMFHYAKSFNQPLDRWQTGNVQSMINMFYGAESFNQDISMWDKRSLIKRDLSF